MGGSPRHVNRGSSPRVRSRLRHDVAGRFGGGIISACAEQTTPPQQLRPLTRDHLRVCGADTGLHGLDLQTWGSSPRVRSRPEQVPQAGAASGIISACAEQTMQTPNGHPNCRDHLRVCGADRQFHSPLLFLLGSSPRVRSRQTTDGAKLDFYGIISACAEQTFLPCHREEW